MALRKRWTAEASYYLADEAAGIPRPDLSHLDEAFVRKMQQARNLHLAIEALRRLIDQEMRKVTKHKIVRSRASPTAYWR